MSSILSRFLPRHLLQGGAPAQAPVAAAAVPAAARPAQPERMAPHADFLLEEELDTGRLLALYRQAFMDVQSVEGSRLRVVSELGIRLLVHADAERKVIFFAALFGLKEQRDLLDKLAFANRVNDKLILARFSVLDATTLYADYHLPMEGGVQAATVIAITRRLGRVMGQAVAELDIDNVVS